MKLLTDNSIVRKIIIALVIVILLNFILPNISNAGLGGVLFEPIKDLLLVISDGIVGVVQGMVFDIDVSFLTIADENGWWASVAGVGAGILTAIGIGAAVIFAPFTGGLSLGIVVGILATSVGVGYAVTQVAADALPPTFKLPMFYLSPEEMFKGSIPLLDVNFFNGDTSKLVAIDKNGDGDIDAEEAKDKSYLPMTTSTGEIRYQKSSALTLKPTISSWYYALRNFAIVALLCILVYIGIRIIISSTANDKAKYKSRLMDWVVAMCLLFFMHYIMAFAVSLTEEITKAVSTMNDPYYVTFGDSESALKNYKYVNGAGDSDGDKVFSTSSDLANTLRQNGIIVEEKNSGNEVFMWPTNMMGRARIELQLEPEDHLTADDIALRQFGYTVIYLALVLYTILFLFRYLKRLLMLTFLTIIAPLVAMTYPLDKMSDGNAQAFNMWFKEYMFNLLIQPVHLILYTVLIGSAMDLVVDNLIYGLVALGFILQAEKLVRKFFGFDKASTIAGGSALGGALAMQGINQLRKLGSGGGGKSGSKGNEKGGTGNSNKPVRTADKGKNINSLLDNKYGEKGDAPSEGSPSGPKPKDSEEDKSPQQKMLDAYDEKFGTDEYDPAEREAMVREFGNENENGMDYSAEEYANILRDSGYSEDEIGEMLKNDPRYATGEGDTADSGTSEGNAGAAGEESRGQSQNNSNSSSKPKRNLKSVAKGLGAVAGTGLKSGAKYVGRKIPRIATRGLLGGAAATVGIAAGLVSDDFSNVIKFGAAGAGAGWVAGGGIAKATEGTIGAALSGVETSKSIYTTAAYGKDAEKERKNKVADKMAMKDKERHKLYAEKLELSSKDAKEAMKNAQKYREYGVTDDEIIIEAMKADKKLFGESPTSEDRLLLAKMASEVDGSKKDLEQLEKALKKRQLPEEEIKKYTAKIRDMNDWT